MITKLVVYQRKKDSLAIDVILFISWFVFVLDIITKSKKKKKKKKKIITKKYKILYNKDFVKYLVTVTRHIQATQVTAEFQFYYTIFNID